MPRTTADDVVTASLRGLNHARPSASPASPADLTAFDAESPLSGITGWRFESSPAHSKSPANAGLFPLSGAITGAAMWQQRRCHALSRDRERSRNRVPIGIPEPF